MLSLKKIKKKKFILKHFNKKIIKSTQEVQDIELNENQTLFIKGEFEFIVLNATITLDLFQIKHQMIYTFNSQNFVNLSCHCNSISIEEFITKFQEQPLTETYTKFVNYIIKYKPNKPTLLIVGSIVSKKSGYFIDETKEKIFKQNPKSIMFLGEKGAGKSISLQQYANKKLNKESVFILDTDLGQSISLPGFVTLFKLSMPSFLQTPQIIYQGFVGEFSVQNHLSLYFNKISQAVLAYNEAQLMRDYPLLINTAGFVTNYGITIIQELINIIKPQSCLILAHSTQKGQIMKAETLKQQLPQNSFFNSQISYTPDIQILIEEIQFDEEQKQTIFNQRNPQMKKNNRIEKIAQNLGLNSLNYLELSSAIPQIISFNFCKFIAINEKQQFYDIQIIAQVFVASLVAIETEDTFLGLGYIKDVDITNNQIHIISKAQINQHIYIIKSKYFDCQIDTYYEIKLDEVYSTLDEMNITQGIPLESTYELPFLNIKCDVIGDRRQIVKINKKKL